MLNNIANETYIAVLKNAKLKWFKTRLELGQLLRGPRRTWEPWIENFKMAARSEPDVQQVINGIKQVLGRQKSQFQWDISNGHKLRDLDRTFKSGCL